MSKTASLIQVAKLGRLVGLSGELKLHSQSDFPEQFQVGKTYTTQKGITLKIKSYNQNRAIVLFEGYESRESALGLVNSLLFSTEAETKNNCLLNENELFWFDVFGMTVLENEQKLGIIKDIHRMGVVDYLLINTDEKLVKNGFTSSFYIPYIDRYVLGASLEEKVVHVKDGLDILENS